MSKREELAATDTAKVPRVSIGMPVYNGAKFIREALDSLLAQTFADFELIISDNASIDGTESICLEYAETDKRIRYVRQAKNMGALANFQFVLDEAIGEYFMWAAADDRWAPEFIEKIIQAHVGNEFINVMTRYFNSSRRWTWLKSYKIPVINAISGPNPEERLRGFWAVPWGYTKANLFYGIWKKAPLIELFEKIRMETPAVNGLDFMLLSHALVKGPIYQVDEVLFEKMHKSLPCGHVTDNLMGVINNPITLGPVMDINKSYAGAVASLSATYPWLTDIIEDDFTSNASNLRRLFFSLKLGVISNRSIIEK